jgi:hypothetical protein
VLQDQQILSAGVILVIEDIRHSRWDFSGYSRFSSRTRA